jgi:hypothetical protein
MFKIFVTIIFFVPSFAFSGGFAPGVWQGVTAAQDNIQRQKINEEWMAMGRAWRACMNQGGGYQQCGSPPPPPQH